MSPEETKNLRKEVKHRMVELELDKPGAYGAIIARMERPVSVQILSMALTGYRNGPAVQSLLGEILDVLRTWPDRAA